MGKWTPERKAGYLTADIGPELKARLIERAAGIGLTVTEYVREVLEDALPIL